LTRKYVRKPKEETPPLTEQEVFDVLKFAAQAYSGIYTPQLVNARLKDITLSPQIATADKINTALSSPKENEQQLIGYTEWMELNSMLFKRILGYFSGLMSFDWNYVCTNIKDSKEYASPAYEKDLMIVADFFDRFNAKQEFRVALKEMMRAEAYYSIFREDDDYYVLQELPQTYCKITGRHLAGGGGLLFDFNMLWFISNPGVSLDMYPDIFKTMYNRMFNPDSSNYNPAKELDARTGQWVYWMQTSPMDGFFCFKLFPEIGSIVPFLSPLLATSVLEPVIRSLQTNSYIQQASKLIFGQIPLIKDAGAKLANQIAMTPEVAGKFLALIQSALPTAIKVAAAPLDSTGAIEFEGSETIYDSYLATSAASSGVNSRLLYSKDRQNILETALSMDIDQNILRPVYYQFENFLNFFVNRRTKKYKFKFLFEGFETKTNRQERFENVTTLAESGIVMEQKFASAIGLSPFDFRRLLEEGKATKFVDKLTPILKSSQMGNPGAGRPASADEDIGDEGANTRGSGGNLGRGGKK
jgi:hypothetical protein